MLLLINISVFVLSISHAAATTCHDLQQSQLLSLNERMNQMIDTISALLPTPLKKSPSLVTPTLTPSTDYTPSSPGYESTYFTPPPPPPPVYTSSTPAPYLMYVSPPVGPLPNAITHGQPNPISPPRLYSPREPDFHPEYAFTPVSNLAPRRARSQYPYEQYPLTQYQNSIPIARLPPSYPTVPYSFMQQPYSANYNNQYAPEYSYAASLRPSIPTYPSGHPSLPLSAYMPPNSFMPAYANQPELPSLYT